MTTLKAPFPWFGGKRLVAHAVWERFGDVPNYVEPFFGSGAVMLGRPTPPRVETVNDIDALLSNFWRAVKADPEAVARWADWPVSEVDLHARHLFLVNRREWVETMMTDPEFYDAQIAGWWVWGLCSWIGGGWCASAPARQVPGLRSGDGVQRQVPGLPHRKHPDLRQHVGQDGEGAAGRGIHAQARRSGQGVHRTAVTSPRRQVPDLTGDSGVHASAGPSKKRPSLTDRGGIHSPRPPHRSVGAERLAWLTDMFGELSDRLRNVRIVSGEWDRILGPTPTWKTGLTGVFLDPPYSLDERTSGIYAHDGVGDLAGRVRAWAIANGGNPLLRIALCGYDTEHGELMPAGWTALRWKAHGGYGSQAKAQGRAQANSRREVVWFSPHCLPVGMFDEHVYQLAALS